MADLTPRDLDALHGLFHADAGVYPVHVYGAAGRWLLREYHRLRAQRDELRRLHEALRKGYRINAEMAP